jgi:glycogen synthase
MADAVIAVSENDRQQITSLFKLNKERLQVIHNGIDTKQYQPVASTAALEKYGIDPAKPYVLFLGRVSRQKGIGHFVSACRQLNPGIQALLCASAPDTPAFALEIERSVEQVQKEGGKIIWIRDMVSRSEAIEFYSHAAVFCCPSIYEPFGIINLEAMACETPVVASSVGGIKEVVVSGKTGFLVEFTPATPDDLEPADPEKFEAELAARMNELVANENLRRSMGRQGRQRVVANFGWAAVAEKVLAVYAEVSNKP